MGYNSAAQYAVAPDGRFLINITAEETVTASITIVLNWRAGLPRYRCEGAMVRPTVRRFDDASARFAQAPGA